LRSNPGHVEVLCNRGIALRALDRIEAALEDYERVLALQTGLRTGIQPQGRRVGRAQPARGGDRELFGGARPGSRFRARRASIARCRISFAETSSRDGATMNGDGAGADTQIALRNFGTPQWQGEDLQGKTILVHAEQGLATPSSFRATCRSSGRAARESSSRCSRRSPRSSRNCPGASTVIAMNEPRPAIDYHCPILSLPFAFATRLDSIPASVPYLSAPAAHLERWRTRLGPRNGLRVGLAWSGNATQANDRNRSIPFERLVALGDPAWTLVSLQKDLRERDRAALERCGAMLRFEDEIEDFRDTAAIIDEVDLVVTADTSVAHLAGAMGKPVWILLTFSADWRWLIERGDSPLVSDGETVSPTSARRLGRSGRARAARASGARRRQGNIVHSQVTKRRAGAYWMSDETSAFARFAQGSPFSRCSSRSSPRRPTQCPQLVEKAQAAQRSGDCEHLANSNLCESHCDYGSASVDSGKLQLVAPDLAIASLRVVAVVTVPADSQWIARLERRPTGPPLTRFTVLRI
jgi:hypothetical protein